MTNNTQATILRITARELELSLIDYNIMAIETLKQALVLFHCAKYSGIASYSCNSVVIDGVSHTVDVTLFNNGAYAIEAASVCMLLPKDGSHG